ncbi:ABC transporter ATP-binding protein [Robbsia sp. KACC 23696]|uniref:ABC transporter ATP-binding protein n=1 Tax=Robbsia sp. KACC 23696 TaxID=3149231 RepID=UPI00325A68AE
MRDSFLHIDQLTKVYPGQSVPSVSQFSLALPQEQMLALLGPSGCGKTTTLRMIAGLIAPTAGTIAIAGRDITHLPVYQRGLGMVFQSYALFPHLTVAQNVAFGLEMRKVSRSETKKRVVEALEMVQLANLADRRISQLSGGQQQRIALARALVVKPAVLLLDEPLSNLDAKLRDAMRAEIRHIQKSHGITAVLVTHDQDEALSMADKVAVMSKGRIEQIGDPEALFRAPATRFAAEFIGRANFLTGNLQQHAGVASIDVAGVGLLPLRTENRATGTRSGIATGASVTAMVRPHRVVLFKAGQGVSASNDGASPAPVTQWASGRVVDRSYTGELISYRIQIGQQTLHAEALSGGQHDPVPGDTVGVAWSAQDLVLLEAE